MVENCPFFLLMANMSDKFLETKKISKKSNLCTYVSVFNLICWASLFEDI